MFSKVLRFLMLSCVTVLPGVCGCAGGGPMSKGAPWTIRCLELQGPNRLAQIERIAETLKRSEGIRAGEVFVTDESDGFARLYYGTYHRRRDRKSGKRPIPTRMRRDIDILRDFGDESGRRYFLRAMPVRKPMPDVGNPAWNLATVSAAYSLQVAVFEPTEDFWRQKQAAAEFCAFLRRKGHEAYYFHASASSMVTVGAFGPQAVITTADGRVHYSAEVRALQQDALLKHNLVNTSVVRVISPEGQRIPVPSRLVEIPQAAESP